VGILFSVFFIERVVIVSNFFGIPLSSIRCTRHFHCDLDFIMLPDLWEVVGLERGPLSLVSTTEELRE
jgi:hypothetical protein